MDRFEILKELEPAKKSKYLIFIPNEIFDDLLNVNEIRNGMHIALAYCYYCLISYLYRYCIYGNILADYLNQPNLKKILGYSVINKEIDYIMKRNGVLDAIGYTRTVTEIPISVIYIDAFGNALNFGIDSRPFDFEEVFEMEFRFLNEFEKPKFKIKYPVKAFERVIIMDCEEVDSDGTFFDIFYTHPFDMRVFLHAMRHDDIGTVGFYLYQFINRHENHSIQITLENLEKRTGIIGRTLDRYLKKLEAYNYIEVIHQDFIVNAPVGERNPPNTYTANSYKDIYNEPYNEVRIRNVTFYPDGDISSIEHGSQE
ncbi:hypothetical protein [Metabacillus litoralis]|uniref:hypothetical protein n=1 Tax=Metabacillus litoralis TaxID=152268 RepID=UPI000EF57169|nr:hypothetical protein [Metabacillus litoralis]